MKRKKDIKPLSIDPAQGFYPHFTAKFMNAYGRDSVFVLAVADVLTGRFINLLINAGRLDADTKPLRLGSKAAVCALEELIEQHQAKLPSSEGIKYFLREATGVTPVGTLSKEIDGVFGNDIFKAWLSLFQKRSFARALRLLKTPDKKTIKNG